MTKKLFYENPYITTFEAEVIEKGVDEAGHPFVVLDQTAFYPTGGGQPHDIGTLNGVKVVDVETRDQAIIHILEQPIDAVKVKGEVDWERRFDHMQQHTGQHILSAAFAERFGFQTVSFHLGKEEATIDLATQTITEEQIQEAVHLANTIVFQNKPIKTIWVDEKELSQYPLRKPPKVKENIRLVIIEGYDYNACGGTHPHMTGEVGPIQVIGWEKNQKGIRIHFLCGFRAVKAFAEKQKVLQTLNRQLSSQDATLKDAIDRLLEKQHELEKALGEAEEELLKHEAAELYQKARAMDGFRLVAKAFVHRKITECQKLSRFILEQAEQTVVLFTTKEGTRLHMIASRTKDVEGDMVKLIESGLSLINGRGGGKPERAQGGGETDLTAEGMLSYLVDQLEGQRVAN